MVRTFPGKNTSTVEGIVYLQMSDGKSSRVLVSTGATTGAGGIGGPSNGLRAHSARPVTEPSSARIVSFGKLITTFFCFTGGGAGEGDAAVGGIGLSLRFGPPRTAFGGPPMLSCLLFLPGNGCPPGGPFICIDGRAKCPPIGVMGKPFGGCIPAAARWAILACAPWWPGRADGGPICGLKKGCIGVCMGKGGLKPCWIDVGRAGENMACIGCCMFSDAGIFSRGRASRCRAMVVDD